MRILSQGRGQLEFLMERMGQGAGGRDGIWSWRNGHDGWPTWSGPQKAHMRGQNMIWRGQARHTGSVAAHGSAIGWRWMGPATSFGPVPFPVCDPLEFGFPFLEDPKP